MADNNRKLNEDELEQVTGGLSEEGDGVMRDCPRCGIQTMWFPDSTGILYCGQCGKPEKGGQGGNDTVGDDGGVFVY